MKNIIVPSAYDFSRHAARRRALVQSIKEAHPAVKNGILLVSANFERDSTPFRQDSSFYYLTGLREPAAVCVVGYDDRTSLYIPNFGTERAKWVAGAIEPTAEHAGSLAVDAIEYLGAVCTGYQMHPFFHYHEYERLIGILINIVADRGTVFTCIPNNPSDYIEQRWLLERLTAVVPGIENALVDISPLVDAMRRKKDMYEIELLYKAIDITALAQEAAANAIEAGTVECEVQASLEYIMTGSGARIAFTSIVASGINGTILHYTDNRGVLKKGDLVIVDIGAAWDSYCADITRTYPVSGTFTKRQREVYMIVLETQDYIASIAKPGMWLSNKEQPDKSLNHLAKRYLQERGYGDYFTHGIGHFLGLDVHDVGDYKKPLQTGDVITIEPGIYIKEEELGIRIEDDYWVVDDGVICLSEGLPKSPDEIEAMVQKTLSYASGDDFDVTMQ